jgi:hypothetical protein
MEKYEIYKVFKTKWIVDGNPYWLLLDYDEFVNNPKKFVVKALHLMGCSDVDVSRLEKICTNIAGQTFESDGTVKFHKSMGAKNNRKVEEFKYYDELFLSNFESY